MKMKCHTIFGRRIKTEYIVIILLMTGKSVDTRLDLEIPLPGAVFIELLRNISNLSENFKC